MRTIPLEHIRRWWGGIATFALLSLLASTAHAAQLSLTWSDASSNEDGFHVERKAGAGGVYATIATPGAGTTGFVDGTVAAGTTYCYRVHAWNTAGDSGYSNEACAAAATPATYAVTVGKAGTGSGTVASSPAGITCGTDCSEAYAGGTSVALSATPAAGSTFAGWTGACAGTGTCVLVVDAAKSLTATFALAAPTTATLTVSKAGTGSGTVTSTPTGVTCGTDCAEAYASGTSVTLTAAASTGSTFAGWGGACAGTGACTVSMTAARSVTATFTATTYPLTLTKSGTGSGTVTSNPIGVSCGTDCTENYNYSTSVTLTAAASTGSTFAGWGGACTGTSATCTVTMTTARSVTATFGATVPPAPNSFTLSVSKTGSGAGIVASNPPGINCGSACSASFASGTNVALEVIPDSGSTFAGWSGACTGAGSCVVSMGQAQGVSATFGVQSVFLNVSTTGTGSGNVTSTPSGITCGTDCTEAYAYNTSVTLSATPAAGSTFAGWGGACTGTGACTLTLTGAKSVTATFQRLRF